MSGTSLDGVDAVVADFAPTRAAALRAAVGSARSRSRRSSPPSCSALQRSGARRACARGARRQRACRHLRATRSRRRSAGPASPPTDVVAAGVHGQTLRHRPDEGWTLQLNNPARVAERTGMSVVADFRSRDVAAGGEGAPLVPGLSRGALRRREPSRRRQHRRHRQRHRFAGERGDVRGFDTGPGNVLLDLWHARHRGAGFDRGRRVGADRARRRRAARGAARGAVLRARAAEEHRPRSLRRGLAGGAARRSRRCAGRRPGDARRADGAHDRRRDRRRTAAAPRKCWSAAAARRTRR